MRVTRRNDLSLRFLEVFGAVMLHRTTVGAAEELGVSQPAVSLAVKQLESSLIFHCSNVEISALCRQKRPGACFRVLSRLFHSFGQSKRMSGNFAKELLVICE